MVKRSDGTGDSLAAGVFRGRVPDEYFVVDDVFKPFHWLAWPKIVHLTRLGLTPEAICDELEQHHAELDAYLLAYVRAVRDRLKTRQDATPPNIEGMGTEEARCVLLEAAWEVRGRPLWTIAKQARDAAIELWGEKPALNFGTDLRLVQDAWRTVRTRHK